jgi:hypothetical protein
MRSEMLKPAPAARTQLNKLQDALLLDMMHLQSAMAPLPGNRQQLPFT